MGNQSSQRNSRPRGPQSVPMIPDPWSMYQLPRPADAPELHRDLGIGMGMVPLVNLAELVGFLVMMTHGQEVVITKLLEEEHPEFYARLKAQAQEQSELARKAMDGAGAVEGEVADEPQS